MDNWEKVGKILKSGGVVIIPSDSSYGMAALASNTQAVEKLYQIKGREKDKPSLLIVGSIDQARELVKFTPLAEDLVKKYWPGGLTLVLEAKNMNLPTLIYGTDHTLALRFPDKKELQELALTVGPFILPSANFAGEKSPFRAEEVSEKLKHQVDFFLNEPTDGNTPSTLVDATGEKSCILRQGKVKVEVRN